MVTFRSRNWPDYFMELMCTQRDGINAKIIKILDEKPDIAIEQVSKELNIS